MSKQGDDSKEKPEQNVICPRCRRGMLRLRKGVLTCMACNHQIKKDKK